MYFIFILIFFAFVCYSGTQFIVYLNGPFHVFEKFRRLMQETSTQLGELVGCEACTGTWVSFMISALNLVIIPDVAFTPSNAILEGTGLWWLIILLDGLYGSGAAWLLFRIEDFLADNSDTNYEYGQQEGD